MNKTPTLGKNLNAQKIPSADKGPSPEETPTLEDKSPALGAPPEDEGPEPKMGPPGDKASTLEKALTFSSQVLPQEASAGDNTQLHSVSPEVALPKGKSVLVTDAQPQEEVNMPQEPPLCMMKHPLDKTDSSALQSEPQPESVPALEKAQPPEETPAKEETTPKEVEPAQKNLPPVKLTPDPQETPTLHSLAPQNPTDSKNDRNDVMRLQDEVESLRRALELMGVQLE